MKLRVLPAKTPYFYLALFAAALICAIGALVPAPAHAESYVAYVRDASGKNTYYTSKSDAEAAAYGSGKTLVLLEDWLLESTMCVADSQELTIDMNGYRISRVDQDQAWDGSTIQMYEHSKLTLYSSRSANFTFEGDVKQADGTTWKWQEISLRSGGLITNGGNLGGAGISMDAGCTLTAKGIAFGGCSKSGIETKKDCTVNLSEGTVVQGNDASSSGGGVEIGDNCTLNMNNAKITKNWCKRRGGGLFAGANATIYLENNSEISENSADAGGGVYLNYSGFTLESKDGTGSIWGNIAAENGTLPVKEFASGGGIHVDKSRYSANKGLIKNLEITDNYSYWDGGAIELDQQNTTIENCVIKNNGAYCEGGGIYVCNKNNVIKNTVIQDNYSNGAKKNYEGGGVYVWCDYDIELQGTVNITGNTRGKNSGNPDNLFLRDNAGSTARAYITGTVSTDSKIGVRTGVTGDRRIGKKISDNGAGSFYMDLDDYHITYGSDEGGDMWQRAGAYADYAVTLNGVSLGHYAPGSTVTVSGETSDAATAFKCWSTDSMGLAPFEDYFTDIYDSTLTFVMPKNDVKLKTERIKRTGNVILSVKMPTPGEDLPSEATLSWGEDKTKDVSIVWLDENGQRATQAAYGARYLFRTSIAADQEKELAFLSSMKTNDVKIYYADTASGPGTLDAYVDASGRLCVTSNFFETYKPRVKSVEKANITVTAGTSREDFVNALPTTARVTLESGAVDTLKTDVSTATGIEYLMGADDKVKEPTGESATYTVKMNLAEAADVDEASKSRLTVNVTVLMSDKVATPVLSPIGGTYTKDGGETKLDENGNLKVGASCSTPGASIRYRIDNGLEQVYSPLTGIVLNGEAGTTKEYKLTVWAVKGETARSEIPTETYVLDNTVPKTEAEIAVNCSDTALYAEGEQHWSDSFKVKADEGATAQITAPMQYGHIFDHWEWEDAPKGTDLDQETLTITNFSADYSGKITAVYTPVITAVDLHVDAPSAHALLVQGAQAVLIKTGRSDSWVDVTKYFSSPHGAAAITWAPAGDELGAAAHLTSYTASLELEAGGAAEGVKYALADNLGLYVNGKESGGTAYISEREGVKSLNAVFPETEKYEYASMDKLDDVEISFADAMLAQSAQDAGGEGDWGLPKEVGLTFKCKETDLVDVEWDKVSGFDATKLEAQTFTVKGTVKYPDYVDATGAPESVEVTVKVAAPEQTKTPEASLASGTYAGTQGVELDCETSSAVIRYTTDGSEPTEKSAAFDGDPIEVAHNTTLKAKAFCDGMKPSETASFTYTITHKVTFDSAGGSVVTTQVVEDGKVATEPDAPTLVGFDFEGWCLADGTQYTFKEPVTEDVALTARWSRKGEPVSAHVVSFDSAGGTEVAPQTVTDGGYAIEPETPELEGFDFEGWYLEGASEPYDFGDQVWASFTLYARWSKRGEPQVAHLVTFDSAGGSAVASQTVSDNELAIEPEAPTYEGYDFAGWYLEDGTTKYDFATPVTADLTLYAKWTKKADPEPEPEPEPEPTATYLVIFDSEGGSSVPAQTVEEGKTVVKPDDPLRLGYNFDGWYLEGSKTAYDFKTPVTDNLVLHAKWTRQEEPTASYLVTFDSAGGSAVASQTVKEGDKVTKPEDPTRDGYTFTGWLLSNEAYDFETPVTSDLTLVASWKQNDSKKDDEDKKDEGKDDKQDDRSDDKSTPKKRSVLPGTGDASAMVGIIAAAGAALTAYGTRRRRK